MNQIRPYVPAPEIPPPPQDPAFALWHYRHGHRFFRFADERAAMAFASSHGWKFDGEISTGLQQRLGIEPERAPWKRG